MTYHIFCTFLNLTLISRDEFISKFNLDELKSDPISLYELVLAMTPQLLFQYIRVFIANDEVRFLERVGAFEIVDLTDGGEQTAGRIDGRNFDRFRESVASVLGLKKPVDKPVRFNHADNDPVDLIVMLLSNHNTAHIKVLEELVDLLGDAKKREAIRLSTSAYELLSIIS